MVINELMDDKVFNDYQEDLEMAANQGNNVTTGEVRFSFAHVFKPHANNPGQEEKYSITCLLPKSDTATKARIDAAIQETINVGAASKWDGIIPPNVPTPVWDGDGVKQDGTPFGPECKGCWVFTASSKADYPPVVVDATVSPIINRSEFYSGCYGRVNFNIFLYNAVGKKGVGFGLGSVQKLRDGEPLASSRVSAEDAFGAPAAGAAMPGAVSNAEFGQATGAIPGQPAQPVQGYATPQQSAQPVQPQGINPDTGLPFN